MTSRIRQLSPEIAADAVQAFAGKAWAFVAVLTHDLYALGVACANEPGYSPISPTHYCADDFETASDEADRLNMELHALDERAAFVIVASSMRASA
jgi:hypothetical protein